MKRVHLELSRLLGIRLVDMNTDGDLQSASYYASKISTKPGGKTPPAPRSSKISSGLDSKIGGKIGNGSKIGTKIGGKIGGKIGRKDR